MYSACNAHVPHRHLWNFAALQSFFFFQADGLIDAQHEKARIFSSHNFAKGDLKMHVTTLSNSKASRLIGA